MRNQLTYVQFILVLLASITLSLVITYWAVKTLTPIKIGLNLLVNIVMTFLLWGKPAKKNQGTKRYRIVITEEHCAGHRLDERNCPGIRSFKDAVPWYKRILTPTWIFEQSSNNKWRATNEHGFCVDMIHAMPGDIVYFERIKD